MGQAVAQRRTVGRYVLLSKIATGGMGEVHLARLDSIQGVEKFFAIKLLLPQYAEEQSVIDMFVTEARVASRIAHPNVCQVFELGIEDNELFICMEYLKGIPATSILKTHKPSNPVPAPIAVGIVQQACAGLHFAHQLEDDDGSPLGVVHRDISPGNIFITTLGIVKVLDFGVVKAKDSAYKTRTGALKGKFGYMSPEQIMAQPLDSRSDIFSLGTCLFELLTNRRLFTRDSEYATLKAITESPIPSLLALRPDLPKELAQALKRALSRDLGERFATMREFSQALSAAMAPYGGVADAEDIAEYVQSKYTFQLGEIDKLLQRAKEPKSNPLASTQPIESSSSPGNEPVSVHTEVLTRSITPGSAPAQVSEAPTEMGAFHQPGAVAAPRNWALTIGVFIVGLGVLALAAAMVFKKDASSEPTGIVFQGDLRPDGEEASGGPKSVDKAIVSDDSDAATRDLATTTIDAGAPEPRDKRPRVHRCEKKGSVAARNSCYVSTAGARFTRCLKDNAIEISGAPQISLHYSLDKQGKIVAVEVAPAALADTELGKCVLRVANSVRFGQQDEELRFRIPLRINQR